MSELGSILPSIFEVAEWKKTLTHIADDFTRKRQLEFTTDHDLFNDARRWSLNGKTMDLVMHVERDERGLEQSVVFIIPNLTFRDFFKKTKEGEKIEHWKGVAPTVFGEDKNVINFRRRIKKQLVRNWEKALTA